MKKLLIVLLLLALIPSAMAVTPEATPLEPYYPPFDYEAAMVDPDSWRGEWYTLNGIVNMYHEYEGINNDGTHDSLIYLFLDGDPDKQIIIMYQRNDEDPRPEYRSTVSCYGNFYKLYDQSFNGIGTVALPLFGTFYIVTVN